MQTQNLQENIETKAFENMRKARAELLLAHPFFASYALRLELQADNSCQDLWTDGNILAFNPHYASFLSKERLIGAQAHEIMHLACGHHVRRKGREESLWNKACDYAINYILHEAGFSLPENYRHDKAYKDMAVDDIYDVLLRLYEQELHGGAENANVAEKDTSSEEGGSLGGLDADNVTLDLSQDKNNAQSEESEGENEDEKSKKTKAMQENELDLENKNTKLQNTSMSFHGEVKDHPFLSDNSNDKAQKSAEQEANIKLAQALQSAAFSGETPLGLLRLFKEQISPRLDWRSVLQRFIENCNDGDYTWSSPNRRYIFQNIYLPSRNEPRIPYIALAIDASGSVDEKTLALFCSELENILENYDTNLLIVYHDTQVQGHALYRREDRPLKLSVQGGGGTDFRSIPSFIEKENFTPAALLWFTDLECELFPEEPSYPVLWVSSKKQKSEPPFGDVIYLE